MSEGLFQPDALLPVQFHSGVPLSGERALMLAVLEQALEDYQKYAFVSYANGRQFHDEAVEWLEDKRQNGHPYAFRNLCSALGLDPDWVYEMLKRWKRNQEKSRLQEQTLLQDESIHDLGEEIDLGEVDLGTAAVAS